MTCRSLIKQEQKALLDSAMNCLNEHNQVDCRVYKWFGLVEIAALKEAKAEQLKVFEKVMSKIKPASTTHLALFAAHYHDL